MSDAPETSIPLTAEQRAHVLSALEVIGAAERHLHRLVGGVLGSYGIARAKLVRVDEHDEGAVLVVQVVEP